MRSLQVLIAVLFLGTLAATAWADGDTNGEHGAADSHSETGSHAADSHAAMEGHGEEHGEGAHDEHHQPFNWEHGLILPMTHEGAPDEGSITERSEHEPSPFLALLINFGILAFIIYRFGGPGITSGLKQRKENIMRGIDDAAKMRAEAQSQLDEYQGKLDAIDAEIERVRREMAEAAESERKRIVAEAKSRRERMERDAKELIEQELKGMREELLAETVRGAIKSAEQVLKEHITDSDKDRLTHDHLSSLEGTLTQRGQA